LLGDGLATVPSQARLIRTSFGLVAVVGVVGMVIAMAMATSAWWWDQSASALGTDLTGGRYFNITMVALGIAFLPVAMVMNRLLRDAARAGIAHPRWSAASRVGMFVIALAFALVGMFRIDEGSRANAIHNIAGFAIPLVVMAMMLTAGFGTNEMFPRFSRRSMVILGAIVLLFVTAALGLVSYALMEMLSFAICWWWLVALASRLDRRLSGVTSTEAAVTTSMAT
jgi:Protein of unknown function (DUF998)